MPRVQRSRERSENPEPDKKHLSAEERKAEAEANAERRKAIRDLLYKKTGSAGVLVPAHRQKAPNGWGALHPG